MANRITKVNKVYSNKANIRYETKVGLFNLKNVPVNILMKKDLKNKDMGSLPIYGHGMFKQISAFLYKIHELCQKNFLYIKKNLGDRPRP
jgi:hypothetical protein